MEPKLGTEVRVSQAGKVGAEAAPRDYRSCSCPSPRMYPHFIHEKVEASFVQGHPAGQG